MLSSHLFELNIHTDTTKIIPIPIIITEMKINFVKGKADIFTRMHKESLTCISP